MDPKNVVGKNPYAPETPQWLLWEQVQSAELAARKYDEDATRFTNKAAEQRVKAEAFRVALNELSAGQ